MTISHAQTRHPCARLSSIFYSQPHLPPRRLQHHNPPHQTLNPAHELAISASPSASTSPAPKTPSPTFPASSLARFRSSKATTSAPASPLSARIPATFFRIKSPQPFSPTTLSVNLLAQLKSMNSARSKRPSSSPTPSASLTPLPLSPTGPSRNPGTKTSPAPTRLSAKPTTGGSMTFAASTSKPPTYSAPSTKPMMVPSSKARSALALALSLSAGKAASAPV